MFIVLLSIKYYAVKTICIVLYADDEVIFQNSLKKSVFCVKDWSSAGGVRERSGRMERGGAELRKA